MESKSFDYLNFANDDAIKRLLEQNDKVVFSSKIFKHNHMNWRQERVLLITTKYLYNLKDKSEKRKIHLEKISAVTKSLSSSEFIIHVKTEYDYRYDSTRRDEIIQILKENYLKLYSRNMPIYGIEESKLDNYVNHENRPYRPPKEEFRLPDDSPEISNKALPDLTKGELIYTRNNEDVKIDSFEIIQEVKRLYNESEYLVKMKDKEETLTLRVIEKIALLDTSTITADHITKQIDSSCPFLLQPELVYKTENALYILFKPVIETNLATLLQKEKRMNERKASFFALQIAIALTHLHSKTIAYKRLRTENIILSKDNYILLNNFDSFNFLSPDNVSEYTSALAKESNTILKYLPPEYYWNKGITLASDWWALGITLYELLIGVTPFHYPDSYSYEPAITSKDPTFPTLLKDHILLTDSSIDLITELLKRDSSQRLSRSVTDQPFFNKWTVKEVMEKKANLDYVFLNDTDPITILYQVSSKEKTCTSSNTK